MGGVESSVSNEMISQGITSLLNTATQPSKRNLFEETKIDFTKNTTIKSLRIYPRTPSTEPHVEVTLVDGIQFSYAPSEGFTLSDLTGPGFSRSYDDEQGTVTYWTKSESSPGIISYHVASGMTTFSTQFRWGTQENIHFFMEMARFTDHILSGSEEPYVRGSNDWNITVVSPVKMQAPETD